MDKTNRNSTDLYPEYYRKKYHNLINEKYQKDGNSIMESTPSIHINHSYRGKQVKIHLAFSEGEDDKEARDFYNGLKKIYLEKAESRAFNSGMSALK